MCHNRDIDCPDLIRIQISLAGLQLEFPVKDRETKCSTNSNKFKTDQKIILALEIGKNKDIFLVNLYI